MKMSFISTIARKIPSFYAEADRRGEGFLNDSMRLRSHISDLEHSLIRGDICRIIHLAEMEPAIIPILVSYLSFEGAGGSVSGNAESALWALSSTDDPSRRSALRCSIDRFLSSKAMRIGVEERNPRYLALKEGLSMILLDLDLNGI